MGPRRRKKKVYTFPDEYSHAWTNSGLLGAWAFEEDLSDMIAQESRKRQKRDEEKRGEKKERSYRF